MKLAEKEICTGCGACASICPKNCIDIKANKYGYYYPYLDSDKCINCGACQKACPILDDKVALLRHNENDIDAYAICHKDKEVLVNSTSGGAFTAIVQTYFGNDTNCAVYGCAADDNLMAIQTRIDDLSNINALRKSKYVESYSGKIYKSVKEDLAAGKKVLYSGTPCQCAGLQSFLNRKYDNLITVELICHGVPTSYLLKNYLVYREKLAHGKCDSIEYRSKINSDWMNPKIRLTFDNKKVYEEKSYADDDEYMIGFCRFLCLKDCCAECKFARPERTSDFTIGDFWGIESSDIQMPYKDGISLVLANSAKAKRLMNDMEVYAQIKPVEYKFAQEHNHQLLSPATHDPRRKQFLEDMLSLDFVDLRKKYLKPRSKLMNILSNTLGRETKNRIKRILRMKSTKY